MIEGLIELMEAAEALERDLDGIADEMTYRQIDQHAKAAEVLQLARELLDKAKETSK